MFHYWVPQNTTHAVVLFGFCRQQLKMIEGELMQVSVNEKRGTKNPNLRF